MSRCAAIQVAQSPSFQTACARHRWTDRRPRHPAVWRGEKRRSTADTAPHADHLSLPLSLQKGSTHLSNFPFFPFLFFFFPSKIRGCTWQERKAEEFHSIVTSLAPELTYRGVSLQVQGLWAALRVKGNNHICKLRIGRVRPSICTGHWIK